MARKWNIWSYVSLEGAWVCLGESMTEGAAREGVLRKQESAERLGVKGHFRAIPEGLSPEERPSIDE